MSTWARSPPLPLGHWGFSHWLLWPGPLAGHHPLGTRRRTPMYKMGPSRRRRSKASIPPLRQLCDWLLSVPCSFTQSSRLIGAGTRHGVAAAPPWVPRTAWPGRPRGSIRLCCCCLRLLLWTMGKLTTRGRCIHRSAARSPRTLRGNPNPNHQMSPQHFAISHGIRAGDHEA